MFAHRLKARRPYHPAWQRLLRGAVLAVCVLIAMPVQTPLASSNHGGRLVGHALVPVAVGRQAGSFEGTTRLNGMPSLPSEWVRRAASHTVKTPFYKIQGGYATKDKVGGLLATFSKATAAISPLRGLKWSLSLTPVGFGRGSLSKVKAVNPVLSGQYLQYKYASFIEWFANGRGGLEQGITLTKPLTGPATTPVSIAIQVGGNLNLIPVPNGRLIDLKLGKKQVLTYGGLGASDAKGKTVPVAFSRSKRVVTVAVQDQAATYPVRVDPYFFTYELSASDGQVQDRLGYATSLSADGSIAVVGAITAGSNQPADAWPRNGGGAAYIYARNGANYDQIQELAPSDLKPGACFGVSTALSADGSILAVGAPGCGDGGIAATSTVGHIYIYVRSGDTFTQSGDLTGTGQGNQFGNYLSMSNDGSVLLANAFGSAYVFTRAGDSYIQSQQLDVPHKGGLDQYWGSEVALSGDGTVAATQGDASWDLTEVLVFKNGGSGFQQVQTLPTPNNQLGENFGSGLAVSIDGSVIAVGSENYAAVAGPLGGAPDGGGAVFVYGLQSGTYQQTNELIAGDEEEGDSFGHFVAMNTDASVILVGAPSHPSITCSGGTCGGTFGPGAAYVYAADGTGGYDEEDGLAAYDGSYDQECARNGSCGMFGFAGALSVDGSVALVSAPTHNDWAGAAYVYGPTGAPATTAVARTAGSNPSIYGDSLGFTAALGPASSPPQSGTVEFWAGPPSDADSANLGSAQVVAGAASLSASAVPAGTGRVYAVYGGSPAYAGSQQSIAQTVKPQLALTSGTNPSTAGDTLTFTATVDSAAQNTGGVAFWNGDPSQAGSTELGTAPVSGGQAQLATSELPVGTDTIYAVFQGAHNNVTQTVNPAG